MFLGYICFALFILVCLRGVGKRKGKGKVFAKIHRPVSILLIVTIVVHIVVSWKYLYERPIAIFATGFIAVFFIIFAAISGMLISKRGKGKCQRKTHKIAAVLAGVFIVLHIASMIIGVTAYQNQVSKIAVENIDVSNMSDGVYTGEYSVTYVSAKVEVTVQSGEITNIEIIEHRPGDTHGLPAEAIVHTIREQQRIDVDAVSGATNSSRVLQAAILDALK